MNAEQIRNSWDDDHDVTQPCAFPEPLAEVLTRENRELRAEVERLKDRMPTVEITQTMYGAHCSVWIGGLLRFRGSSPGANLLRSLDAEL